ETDRETVTVEGTVTDENMGDLTVNGEAADLDGEAYSRQIILDPGENIIEVVATDQAGNQSTETITVTSTEPAPMEITDVQPADDVYVNAGDTVEISFSSEFENGNANYALKIPTESNQTLNNNMEETEPGFYTGTWEVPANFGLEEVTIEV